MTTTALNGLYQYILSLNLSKRNSKWLATKILESSETKTAKPLDPEIAKIPEEFRCDPYEISPSGDPFFADKRNVEYVRKSIEEAENEDSERTVLNTKEDIHRYFANL